jgi:hypothetical protein
MDFNINYYNQELIDKKKNESKERQARYRFS